MTPGEVAFLRCPACGSQLQQIPADESGGESLACRQCAERFPVVNDVPRLVLSPLREALTGAAATARDELLARTARSFQYEWSHFSQMRREWERNFLAYMAPRPPSFFTGLRVLDAGCGSGRHAYYAAQYGADVWAVDLGAADVARRNTADSRKVHVVQADLHRLPFEPRSFDFVYSLGVLHHLPDPEGAFRNLLRYVRPGGEVQIYLYGKAESVGKRATLGAISAMRRVTTRLPHSLVHGLSYLAALAVFVVFVLPRRAGRRVPALRGLTEKLPMGAYADYPFRVCVNDQFDRFSAPVENRYGKPDVEGWLERAGLENAVVLWNDGWIGSGRLPRTQTISAEGDESSGADVVSG